MFRFSKSFLIGVLSIVSAGCFSRAALAQTLVPQPIPPTTGSTPPPPPPSTGSTPPPSTTLVPQPIPPPLTGTDPEPGTGSTPPGTGLTPQPVNSKTVVTVTSPTKNASVPGQVTIKASAQSPNGIAFWAIYESGNLVWMDINPDQSINIPLAMTQGSHTLQIEAYDNSFTPTSVSVPVNSTSSGTEITWQACIYTSNGQRYQAMKIYPTATITGVLQSQMFYNSGCNPTEWTDQLNDYGTSMTFGAGSGWIFFFTHRANTPGVSAVWTMGNQTSGCVNYSTAPPC